MTRAPSSWGGRAESPWRLARAPSSGREPAARRRRERRQRLLLWRGILYGLVSTALLVLLAFILWRLFLVLWAVQ